MARQGGRGDRQVPLARAATEGLLAEGSPGLDRSTATGARREHARGGNGSTGRRPGEGAVTTLNALAQLKLNSIPPDGGYEWSVGKVTFGHDDEQHQDRSGVMQGVVWKLPAKMFTDLGGRLTGSLAVSYIPCQLQGDSAATTTEELRLEP